MPIPLAIHEERPATSTTDADARDMFAPGSLPAVAVGGLYVHVPFCFHKCHYCDFYSITRQSEDRMVRYVDLALRELDLWTNDPGPRLNPRTVFFGGGTPTLLPIEQMRRLIAGIRSRVDCIHITEWTIEANPATVTADYAGMLHDLGVNRISLGVQSFHTEELKTLERRHDPEDIPRTLDLLRSAGFERLNVDLIYAIPGQSLEDWLKNLRCALSLGTTHLSCYGLTYEPNTPIAVRQRLGQLQPAEPSLELRMLHRTRELLRAAGLAPYEISNYAASGQECRHNLMYWTGGDYIGIGPSAASHVQGNRWRNRPHLGEWENAIDGASLPAIDMEQLDAERRAGELAMLMLRLSDGIDFADFAARTGYDATSHFADPIDRLRRLGLLVADARGCRLSEAGIDVADAIAAEFI